MISWLASAGIVLAALASLMFSTLTYSLRDFSRTKLEEYLERRHRSKWYESTIAMHQDLIFATAIGRLLANILILIGVLHLASREIPSEWLRYVVAIVITGVVTLFSSVAVPHALAEHAGERFIGSHVKFLHALHYILLPATQIMRAIDRGIGRLFKVPRGTPAEEAEQQLQEEILSVVEEGEKEGVVDEQEREMIESVIQFRDTHVGKAMTARPEIIALPICSSLEQVKQALDESGHSRIPVYEETIDHIIGILYARDLLKHLGLPPEQFEIRTAMRPAFYVPETTSLRNLLSDFRAQKVHMAIVLDEYGSTVGLVTIEDVLEELVGELADEHEPQEPAMVKRIDDKTFEADARVRIDELNRDLQINLPEDAGYETLGGFLSNTLGRIPQAGVRHEHQGARLIVLESEPQRIKRVRIELIPLPSEEPKMV